MLSFIWDHVFTDLGEKLGGSSSKSPVGAFQPPPHVVYGWHLFRTELLIFNFLTSISDKQIIFLSVERLPRKMELGPKMTPTPDRMNVLLIHLKYIFTLKQSGSSYIWELMPKQLSNKRTYHLQFLVEDSSINCEGMWMYLNKKVISFSSWFLQKLSSILITFAVFVCTIYLVPFLHIIQSYTALLTNV